MNDTISRQAVIDELKKMYCAAEEWGCNADNDEAKIRSESCMAAIIEIKLRVEKMPSIQLERRWTPVSEGLPLSREEVIVSICDETGDTRYNYTSHGWLTTDKEYWIVDNEINNYVAAWMPLPKPWKG